MKLMKKHTVNNTPENRHQETKYPTKTGQRNEGRTPIQNHASIAEQSPNIDKNCPKKLCKARKPQKVPNERIFCNGLQKKTNRTVLPVNREYTEDGRELLQMIQTIPQLLQHSNVHQVLNSIRSISGVILMKIDFFYFIGKSNIFFLFWDFFGSLC